MSDDDIYTVRHKRKRAEAQARSVAKRKKRDAPGRDDLGRAAYYVVLGLFSDEDTKKPLRTSIQAQMVALMGHAGFDLVEANAAFLKDSRGTLDSLNGWLARRWYEAGKHLGPEGKPFKRLTGKRRRSDQPMTRSNGGNGRGNGQPLIEAGVTFRLADSLTDPF
ncbi:hypothetical protein [Methylobacterium sp. NEAU K]|uniref:hypothetical protein n=1 Tax=Methylobacterium sp. NEAU K TaxID=3064946 RepID=UPI0027354C87|nr:hypothetical protein [Methylobacterium sp. NEAU K]MDP4006511.1 hypothetical protein [Methylobacterium sp. NEAU K]